MSVTNRKNSMSYPFHPHPIVWNRQHSERFWNFLSAREDYDTNNFSNLVGDTLIKLARKQRVPLSGKVLDFGCGPGILLEKLLTAGATCQGVEISPATAKMATQRLQHEPQFLGVTLLEDLPLPMENNSFDVIFLLETIEHLLNDELNVVLRELWRMLKPGGYIIITTPNEENLIPGNVICPECGCIFHRGQHVRSWDRDSLNSLIEAFGFHTVLCKAVTLRPASKLNFLRDALAAMRRHKKMNLIYIGRKP